jgi:hypothetical protein
MDIREAVDSLIENIRWYLPCSNDLFYMIPNAENCRDDPPFRQEAVLVRLRLLTEGYHIRPVPQSGLDVIESRLNILDWAGEAKQVLIVPPQTADSKPRNVSVPWDDKDPAYYANKEAICDAQKIGVDNEIDDLKYLDYQHLKKMLRSPQNTIRYMSKPAAQHERPHGKVHKADFQAYLQRSIGEKERLEHFVEKNLS